MKDKPATKGKWEKLKQGGGILRVVTVETGEVSWVDAKHRQKIDEDGAGRFSFELLRADDSEDFSP